MNNLRPYQQAAVEAAYRYLRTRNGNPCIVLPTGTGKSYVIAKMVSDAVQQWGGRVLVLAHVKELLEQNHEKIMDHAPEIDVGIYSAGLNSRDIENPVIVAGIQSVYQRACELGPFDLVIIDEAHLIPLEGEGMYRQFLADAKVVNPHMRVIGLTATPYRLRGGEICAPENILNDICYEAGLKEMIHQGYLCTLKSKSGKAKADLSNVHIRAGEFLPVEMAEAFDKKNLVRSACQEIVELTRDRKSVLVFAASVLHAKHVVECLTELAGQEVGLVTGDTPAQERAEIVKRFKGVPTGDLLETHAPLKYLVNVRVFTTGFDATCVDTIVMLFGTASTGLYVQVVGRGTRTHPGKEYCLILDYGQNIIRHGPVDAVTPRGKRAGNNGGESPVKECPNCGSLIHAAYQICPDCGAALPPPARKIHGYRADGTPILSGDVLENTYEVTDAFYTPHTKKGADAGTPQTMRIEYQVGVNFISEWVCPEHTGWARERFEKWWRERSSVPPPISAGEAVKLANAGALATPSQITVRTVAGEPFPRIINYVLGPIPKMALVGQSQEKEISWDEDEEEIPF